jgi:hypothetical protein
VLQNAGTLHVGGIGSIGTTTLTGDLVQSSTGRMHIDIDPALGRADLLQISGRAALDGTAVVNPISVRKGTSGPVITAAGGLTITPILEGFERRATPIEAVLPLTPHLRGVRRRNRLHWRYEGRDRTGYP